MVSLEADLQLAKDWVMDVPQPRQMQAAPLYVAPAVQLFADIYRL